VHNQESKHHVYTLGFFSVVLAFFFLNGFLPKGQGKKKADEKAAPQEGRPAAPNLQDSGLAFEMRAQGLPRGGQWRGLPAVADLDGDGHLDIACSIRKADGLHVMFGDGKGGFTDVEQDFNKADGYGGAEILDMTGDGKPDIIFGTHRAPMVVYQNLGERRFKETSQGLDNEEIVSDIAVGDIDGDKHPDIAAIGLFGGGVFLWKGDGKGGFTRIRNKLYKDDAFGREIVCADVNRDGRADIVVTQQGPKVLIAHGEGFQFQDQSQGLPVPLTTGTDQSIAVEDVDGDGKPEIALATIAIEGNPGIEVFKQAADGTWASLAHGLPRGFTTSSVAFGDIDGDKKIDLLVASEERGLTIFLGDGHGNWKDAGSITETARLKHSVAIADLDRDGRTDLVSVFPYQPGAVQVWFGKRLTVPPAR
jgi:hypothetical protein